MITLGVMTLTIDSEQSYINDIALQAESCGMEVFRFLPSSIHPHTLKVTGKKFDPTRNAWISCELPIPEIVYDRCFYGDDEHSKQCLPIVSWLKSRHDITFLGYGLPNKLELYQVVKGTHLSSYLPASQLVTGPDNVIHALAEKKRIILKPINGSQGYGIYYIKKNEKTYQVKTEKHNKIISRIFPNEAKLIKWLQTLVRQREFLLQPYLELSNNEQKPFDIRVLMQKNEQGNWGEMGRGVRIGSTGGILSNLSAGGSVIPFNQWLKSIPIAKGEFICQELDYILAKLPSILEQQFMPLFEVGVDIGIAKNNSIWILDINSKPGRKVLMQTNPNIQETLALAPLLYGKTLSQIDKKERRHVYEKTLSN